MIFYHLADLHFGKTIYGQSMLEDQRHWVGQFLQLCAENHPAAVVIAGDVYDRSAPSGDAVELLDHLLTELAQMDTLVFMIAGNHDSGQRLSFGSSLLARQNIHIAGKSSRQIDHVTLEDPDGHGLVTFWLLPYTYPEQISLLLDEEEGLSEDRAVPESEASEEDNAPEKTPEDGTPAEPARRQVRTYDEAVRALLAVQDIDPSHRNIIVSHQNVTSGGQEVQRGGSESMVGGVGQIDFSAYEAFDYAALGHIHSSYSVGRPEVRYAGTPLCYHFNETRQQEKGPVEVELLDRPEGARYADVHTRVLSIEPLHRMRQLTGTKQEIYDLLAGDPGRNEYISITLTDERLTPETASYLRQLLMSRGSILMELTSEYSAFAGQSAAAAREAVDAKAVEDLFADFYTEQTGGIPPEEDEYEMMQYAGQLLRHCDISQPLQDKDIQRLLEKAGEIGMAGEKTAGSGLEQEESAESGLEQETNFDDAKGGEC